MRTRYYPLRGMLLLIILGFTQVFCGASNQATNPPPPAEAVETSVAQTLTAQQTAVPQGPAETKPSVPQATEPPVQMQTEPPPASQSTEPPVQVGSPTISVSIDTNCRAGPSVEYEKLGFLLPGEIAVVLGHSDSGDWWYIENPRKSGENCWL